MRVGVPAPGGTSGAGDRRLPARATAAPPPPRHHGDAVAPRPAEPAERPGRGAARGRAQAWRRRDEVGDRAPRSTRRGGGDRGQATRGFEPLSRAHLPAPARAPPRLSPAVAPRGGGLTWEFLLLGTGKGGLGTAGRVSAGVRMGTL